MSLKMDILKSIYTQIIWTDILKYEEEDQGKEKNYYKVVNQIIITKIFLFL